MNQPKEINREGEQLTKENISNLVISFNVIVIIFTKF